MEVILREKDAGEWVYRGEGAANLVLAYTGSSPTFVRSSILCFKFSIELNHNGSLISGNGNGADWESDAHS